MENSEIQASHEEYEYLLGHRVVLKHQLGSIRYAGKLINNPKAGDDIWLGIEWDEEGQGKHCGTVDGVKYFECEFHKFSPSYPTGATNCCSFIRHGKIQIGGTNLREAIIEKYRPDDLISNEERDKLKKLEEEELYVNTDKKGMKKIEILGTDQSYQWRSDIRQSYEIALEFMKISDLGPKGTLSDLIPNTMNLYLDKNLLYSWDQFFQITKELRYLSVLTLTGNKFKRIDKNYFQGKRIEELIHPFLQELVLIDMSMDWSQIDILSPAFVYVEQLHLVRCQCNKICSEYEISKDNFKNLKFLNLEQNNIESWDEVVGFRNLPSFRRLTLNKNKIKEIYYKPGFRDLYMVSIEDNLIADWKPFDALNEYKTITVVRCGGNPVLEKLGTVGRNMVIARMQFLKSLNGSEVEYGDRRDAELHYIKKAYEEYIRNNHLEQKIEITDEKLMAYMNEFNPRWYELVEVYGNPQDSVSLKQEQNNISSTSAKLKLISVATGKTLEKKLLLSMTVNELKAMCSKLFKIEVIRQKLTYKIEGCSEYVLDEDLRQLSFYSMADGGEVRVELK